jgi:hypothetical protein
MTSAYANNPHPDTLDIEAQIRDAYRQLATGPEPDRAAGRLDRLGPIVPLADLRAALPDVPRDTLDTALTRLADHSDVHVIPSGRIAHTHMAQEDRDAALWLGGQHNHTIHIDDTRTTDGIVARLHMRERDQASSMVAALEDREVDSVARAMGVHVVHGAPEVTRQRLIDASVANHDAWLADARQGAEDGALLYRADTDPDWVAGWTDGDRQRAREAGRRLLERANNDESWAYVRERAARWPNRAPTPQDL